MIAEHRQYQGKLIDLAHGMSHREKLVWCLRISNLNKDPSEKTVSTSQSSELAWTQLMAHSMIPRGK